MHDFRKLKIWERSKDLSVEIYKITAKFPKHELYSITSQIRRASSSVPANIAESSGRNSEKDFSHFLVIALGSLNELYTFLQISKDLKFLNDETFNSIIIEIEEIRNMIYIFRKNLSS
jgi:four helix bundle protein